MAKGTVKRLMTNKGYGFIRTEDGDDLFFHRNEVQGVTSHSLKKGQQVEYEAGTGRRDGRPEATKVRLASPKVQ